MAPEGMSVQWQLARDGKQFGPISALEMAKLIELGHLKQTDLIWRVGFSDWVSPTQVPELNFSGSSRPMQMATTETAPVLLPAGEATTTCAHHAAIDANESRSNPADTVALGNTERFGGDAEPAEIEVGAHLVSPRMQMGPVTLYDHHGIYVGNGEVLHYSGLSSGFSKGPISRTSLKDFMGDDPCTVRRHTAPLYSGDEAAKRAKDRLCLSMTEKYNVISNNCEHFANWCIEGDRASFQVENLTNVVFGSVGGGALGFTTTSFAIPLLATGTAAAFSGAGMMGSLATAGAAVGGGAVAGIGVLATAPAYLATRYVGDTMLKDNEKDDEAEKKAKQVGRVASVAGAAAGLGGTVATIGAAGSVAGLSGAGITSGLAAIGGTVGGGMAAGAAIAVAAPAVAAVGVAYGVYRLTKWLVSNEDQVSAEGKIKKSE